MTPLEKYTRTSLARDTHGSDWARWSRKIIQGVLGEEHESPEAALKAIDAAYPFWYRKYHPYKMWLKERRLAMVALGLRDPDPVPPRKRKEHARNHDERQGNLF